MVWGFNSRAKAERLSTFADTLPGAPNTGPQLPPEIGLPAHGESLLALTPTGGIPKLAGDQAGSAVCEIYYINENGQVRPWDGAPTNEVYNVSESDIAEAIYVPCTVVNSLFIAQAGGGGFKCEDLCDCEDYLPASPNICSDP